MEIFKTQLFFDGYENGIPHLLGTIFLDGAWWLVASWLGGIATGGRVPERLVRLTGLPHQEVNDPRFRFLLTNSLPKSVYDGKAQDGYVVAYYPVLAQVQGPSDGRSN